MNLEWEERLWALGYGFQGQEPAETPFLIFKRPPGGRCISKNLLSRNHAIQTQCLPGLFAQGRRREALPDP